MKHDHTLVTTKMELMLYLVMIKQSMSCPVCYTVYLTSPHFLHYPVMSLLQADTWLGAMAIASWKILWSVLPLLQGVVSQRNQDFGFFSFYEPIRNSPNILTPDTPVYVEPVTGTCGAAKQEFLYYNEDRYTCGTACVQQTFPVVHKEYVQLAGSEATDFPICDSREECFLEEQNAHGPLQRSAGQTVTLWIYPELGLHSGWA